MERVTLEDLSTIARTILTRASALRTRNRAVVVALEGDLGAGKTTLTQAIAKALNVTTPVVSPTYVLMKSYSLTNQPFTRLVHIDAYRLAGEQEFSALAPNTFLDDKEALVVVEWPERVGTVLPRDITVRLSSEGAGEKERYIEVI